MKGLIAPTLELRSCASNGMEQLCEEHRWCQKVPEVYNFIPRQTLKDEDLKASKPFSIRSTL